MRTEKQQQRLHKHGTERPVPQEICKPRVFGPTSEMNKNFPIDQTTTKMIGLCTMPQRIYAYFEIFYNLWSDEINIQRIMCISEFPANIPMLANTRVGTKCETIMQQLDIEQLKHHVVSEKHAAL